MNANYKTETALNVKDPKFVLVFNYHTINEVSNHTTNNRDISQFRIRPVGVWNVKPKENKMKSFPIGDKTLILTEWQLSKKNNNVDLESKRGVIFKGEVIMENNNNQ